jgi:ribosomal protein S18 acetylase RimI-like enzyme
MRHRFAPDPASRKPLVRRAGPDDVEAMARVSVDTWRLTYPGILPEAYLARLNLGDQELQRRRLLAGPSTAHFIAEESVTNEAVAFASCGSSRGRPEIGVGEIYELYVQNGFQGQGLGRALVTVAREWLGLQGHSEMLVRVLAQNPARGFYERLGGEFGGMRMIHVGGARVEEAAYVWRGLGAG